ncbi:nitrate reductase associated protein [Flavihumibacter fluvii]|uniref:nitrate reductase associated protein n=1 Tax=Flavihumibacter fluvii TaxID=2838157 RepID=UPI001BDE6321|nr:nitrate reductase associated protein [Flavihumibacter fluvii]ULQ52815.1 nitrate reductase associated protein [Flavihumibacter fluvii]
MDTINYFLFETDFVEDNIRCIPMVVRMKLDLVGIKMSLAAWSRCTAAQRKELVDAACKTSSEKWQFAKLTEKVIRTITGEPPVLIAVEKNQFWEDLAEVPEPLVKQAALYGLTISVVQWQALTPLQRFALVKLCRPGHENRNFPFAMQEFGLAEHLPINALL